MRIELKDGLKIGERLYKGVTLQRLTAGMVMETVRQAEEVRIVPGHPDPVIIASPSAITFYRVAAQIRELAADDGTTMHGPLPPEDMRGASERDYRALIEAADLLDAAALGMAVEGAEEGRAEAAT